MDAYEIPAGVELRKVSLSKLRYGGDAPGGSINARKTDRGATDGLVASVKGEGVILPLAVKEIDGLFYAIDGDRRLNALYRIHCAARRPNDYPIIFDAVAGVDVPVAVHNHGDALELSLQAQLDRADLHPVDRMEAFAEILTHETDGPDGVKVHPTVEDIAARFSMRPAQVKQSLRLGGLAPAIREAWRAGALDAATAEAFTLCRDEKQQIKILDRLNQKVGPGGRLTPHHVRQALKAQPGEVRRLLRFVGAEAYEAEGFAISESLFSIFARADGRPTNPIGAGEEEDHLGEPIVSDFGALKTLAEMKLERHADSLINLSKAEGGPWAWARAIHNMPKGWESWPRMEIEQPKIKDRASVGCVVSIDGEGCLQVEDRIYWSEAQTPASGREGSRTGGEGRPSSAGNPAAAAGDDGGNAAGSDAAPITGTAPISDVRFGDTPIEQIPGAQSGTTDWANADLPPRLQQQLAEQLQAGLAEALKGRNDLALPLLLAGLASGGEVIAISRLDQRDGTAAYPFEEALEQYAAMDLGAQLRALATVVAAALSLTIAPGQMPPAFMPGPKMLMRITAKLMGPRGLKKHLVAAFDAEGYVKAAPKAQLLMAIGECCGAGQAEKLAGKSIAEIRKFAAVHLVEQKWLPPELTGGILDTPKPAVKRPAPKTVKGRVKKAAALRGNPPSRKALRRGMGKAKRSPEPKASSRGPR